MRLTEVRVYTLKQCDAWHMCSVTQYTQQTPGHLSTSVSVCVSLDVCLYVSLCDLSVRLFRMLDSGLFLNTHVAHVTDHCFTRASK